MKCEHCNGTGQKPARFNMFWEDAFGDMVHYWTSREMPCLLEAFAVYKKDLGRVVRIEILACNPDE